LSRSALFIVSLYNPEFAQAVSAGLLTCWFVDV
jgi:hypothetical protein